MHEAPLSLLRRIQEARAIEVGLESNRTIIKQALRFRREIQLTDSKYRIINDFHQIVDESFPIQIKLTNRGKRRLEKHQFTQDKIQAKIKSHVTRPKPRQPPGAGVQQADDGVRRGFRNLLARWKRS